MSRHRAARDPAPAPAPEGPEDARQPDSVEGGEGVEREAPAEAPDRESVEQP